ncbi:MAG: flagellar assembly protein FliW [Actinomycetia bacterium]|nr:flagellar assembly protein FliW [Actinomycetes bacterium]MCP4960865.1 flagellar assembly protein FliW [Actinomycetes bacterium]
MNTDDPTILNFEDGIIGLPATTQFVLTQVAPDAPEDALFQLLRSLDGELSLVVTQPWILFPDYAPDVPESELERIGATSESDVTLFNPVTLDGEEGCVFVNLLGPFVVNLDTLKARQVVLADSDYPVRARVDLADA